ncbi:hypothetical protein SERLADRAFT_435313 [Serpula lacrymans var. lacrymans S7.9]|uniref:Xylanolytic transcriptional activator regulatory domain-containing protein n=1 Tax=Serpula lacrymans var. lacrymans (strain S7.9) TaxID=578457 RepID=F8NNA9_SERL9|nr:uncharacterized protein SERLADRAFT_435313 [Serpula lacrymans var. lacrymans S7.9]EGO27539.1 hypothetical protein SERLADRAFT_435313 [Serpula lacrymans var. lacrymans S7.9]
MVKHAHHSPSSTGATESILAKRKKVEDDDTSVLHSKKPRTRLLMRRVPSSKAKARKVPELCKAYTPGKTDQDISVRLSRLEHIIEMALPQYFSSGSHPSSVGGDRLRSGSEGPDEDNRSNTEDQDPSGGTFQSGKWYGNSASGSVAPASVLEQLANVVVASSHQDHWDSGHPTPSHGPTGANHNMTNGVGDAKGPMATPSIIDSVRQDSEPSAADNLKSLVQECGVSPHKISELLQELPPQRFSGVLIDYYFSSINWTRYPVSEQDFRAAYSSICINGVGANPNDARFLPLLFVVLAIAVRLAPEHIAGDSRTRRLTSLRYYWSSRRSLLIAAAIQPDSLDIVLTRLLSARFLTFDRRITECWSQLGAAVRTAQALGLHRDGAPMGMDPAQVEYRRRIWSYLYHADRSYALVLGRPHAIQDDYTSTLPPSNIDDDSSVSQIRTPPPISSPTLMTFVILRHNLATVIGRMVHHFQQVRTPSHYSDVLSLDDDLLKFVGALPPHFAFEPDTSLDDSLKFLPIHRFLLITEILFVRISLHRPYLLRRLSSDRYLRSRTACFESAMKDFEVRQSFRESMPKETRDSLSNAYREFQTAMISGIYLVLDPLGKDASTMHTILDGFLKDHEGVREMDETTRRELKTIEFLKNRASQMQEEAKTLQETLSVPSDSVIDPQLSSTFPACGPRKPNTLSTPHTPFSSMLSTTSPPSANNTSPHMSPSVAYAATTQFAQSPAIHRLQHTSSVEASLNSPAGTNSPSGDDESTAQSLLDHWCSTFSNGSTMDGPTSMAGLSWGGAGGGDFSGWVGGAAPPLGPDGNLLNGVDSSDWSYWETLVNQIQTGPAV